MKLIYFKNVAFHREFLLFHREYVIKLLPEF